RQATIAAAAVGLAILAFIVHDHQQPLGQPLDFTSGISVWTPTLIRYLSLMLAIVFIGNAIYRLANNGWNLAKKYNISVSEPAFQWWNAIPNWGNAKLTKHPNNNHAPYAVCRLYF